MRVYVAGAETAEPVVKLCERLGYETFLHCRPTGHERGAFAACLRALEEADLVLVELDDIDAQGAWAAGYGVARGKSTLGYRRHARVASSLFIEESALVVVGIKRLEQALTALGECARAP